MQRKGIQHHSSSQECKSPNQIRINAMGSQHGDCRLSSCRAGHYPQTDWMFTMKSCENVRWKGYMDTSVEFPNLVIWTFWNWKMTSKRNATARITTHEIVCHRVLLFLWNAALVSLHSCYELILTSTFILQFFMVNIQSVWPSEWTVTYIRISLRPAVSFTFIKHFIFLGANKDKDLFIGPQ